MWDCFYIYLKEGCKVSGPYSETKWVNGAITGVADLGWEIRSEFRKIPENFRFRTHFWPFFSDFDSASERKNRSRHRSPRSRLSYSLINYLPATNLRAFFRRKFPEFRNRRRKFRFRTAQRGVRFQRKTQPRLLINSRFADPDGMAWIPAQ